MIPADREVARHMLYQVSTATALVGMALATAYSIFAYRHFAGKVYEWRAD